MGHGIASPDAVNGVVVILVSFAILMIARVKPCEFEIDGSAGRLLFPKVEEVSDGLGNIVVGGKGLGKTEPVARIVARVEQGVPEVRDSCFRVGGGEMRFSGLAP